MTRALVLTTVIGLFCIGPLGCGADEGSAVEKEEGEPNADNIGQVSQAAAVCPNGVQVRKEIRTLTSAEWTRFGNAIRKLQAGSAPTAYDKVANLHFNWQTDTHSWPMFFPFHRAYLREFEQKLQAIDPGVTLPYWNTAIDSLSPETSPVWRADRFGGNGSGSRLCVQDGYFAGLQAYYPTRHCLSRAWDEGAWISSWYSTEVINSYVTNSQTYDAFRNAVEHGSHNTVHTSIGGDMRGMSASNDPVFWIVDAHWDKIWADWQRSKPANMKAYGGRNRNGTAAVTTDVVRPYTLRVQDVFDTRSLCYEYR